MSYDWLTVAFGYHQPIVTNAGYPNDPRKLRPKLMCCLHEVSGVANLINTWHLLQSTIHCRTTIACDENCLDFALLTRHQGCLPL